MIKILISMILTINIFAAVIVGNQNKVSITGGSMEVSAQGVTQVVNSGQMTTMAKGKHQQKQEVFYQVISMMFIAN